MQAEERNTGAISNAIYKTYLNAGNGVIVLPLLLLSVVLIQVSNVMSSYWYVCYWIIFVSTDLCAGSFIGKRSEHL